MRVYQILIYPKIVLHFIWIIPPKPFCFFWFVVVFFWFWYFCLSVILTVKIRKTWTGTSYQKIWRASKEWQRSLSVIASDAENFKNYKLGQTRKKKKKSMYALPTRPSPAATTTHTHTHTHASSLIIHLLFLSTAEHLLCARYCPKIPSIEHIWQNISGRNSTVQSQK